MPYLLAGVLFLWLAIPALRAFTRLQPALIASLLRNGAAIGCFVVALLLVMRGRFDFAVAAGAAGLWLIGARRVGPAGSARQKAALNGRRTSRVRSAMIEMELDHGTGALRGLVLAGRFQDRTLDSLSARECLQLLDECASHDTDAERLLEAYLDRRFAGWRTAKKDGVDSRSGSGSSNDRPFAAGPMTDNEAYEVLGLRRGASRDEISRAHRTLMKKLHPDQGGSTQLAARVNEAKDILLRRHS